MKKFAAVCAGVLIVCGMAFGGAINRTDVSSTATWVAHFDMEKFMSSRIGKLMTDETANEELKKGMDLLRGKMGFDPMKAVNSVTLYGSTFKHGEGVAIFRGNGGADIVASVEKLVSAAKDYEQVTYGARVIHKWTDEHKNKPSVLCFYAPGISVVSGNIDEVKAAIDVLDGKKESLKADSALAVPGNGSFLTIAAVKNDEKVGENARAAVFQNASWLVMSAGNAAENMDLNVKIGVNTEENARKIEQIVRGIVAFSTLSKDHDPAMVDIAKAVSVNVDKDVVGVSFSYPAAELYKIMKECKAHHRHNHGGTVPQEPETSSNGAGENQLFKF